MNEEEIRGVLGKVMHPEINASLIDLGIIKDIIVGNDKVSVTMAFPFPGIPIKSILMDSVKEPLEKLGLQVEVKESIMNQEELQKFFKMEQEDWKGL